MESCGHPPDPSELEARLGHVFQRPELLEAALTHRSFSAEAGAPGLMENQRLEFLGDAVLGAVSAEWLVAHRADWREGTLTKVRSRLTNAAALARVAHRLELGGCLRLGRGEEASGGREKNALLADALEAVLGALWLDGGVDRVRQVFAAWFADEIAAAVEAGGDDNPKGDLQERLQRERQKSPRYEVVEEQGPSHARHFKVAVFLGEEWLGEGEGASKREAEMAAARQALARLAAHVP
ncbi:MAG TPA: ribonuclease III [Verrucomicrobia bacterium]|nr:ribonuclease III [Verrucomicrobiota bacterium]